MNSSSKVRRCDKVLEAEIDGEIVLMSAVSGSYCGLDDICGEIWRRLSQPAAVRDLCAALTGVYDGDSATIERETIALLEQMAAQSLVEQMAVEQMADRQPAGVPAV